MMKTRQLLIFLILATIDFVLTLIRSKRMVRIPDTISFVEIFILKISLTFIVLTAGCVRLYSMPLKRLKWQCVRKSYRSMLKLQVTAIGMMIKVYIVSPMTT